MPTKGQRVLLADARPKIGDAQSASISLKKVDAGGTAHTTSRLPLYLAAVATLLAIYASLHPFTGWRDTGGEPLAFLFAGWPRYFTHFDLAANVLAYIPLGFLWVVVFCARLPRFIAFFLALVVGTGLSLGIETAQAFLPDRVPSNLDLACNALGSGIGALAGALWGRRLIEGGGLHHWRERHFLPGPKGDAGLVLLGLLFFTHLNPESSLFGNGNLRSLLGLPAPFPFDADRFIEMGVASVSAQTLAILLIGTLLAPRHPVLLPIMLLGAAIPLKSLAIMLLTESPPGLDWLTQGTLTGLALGLALWALSGLLGPRARHALAMLSLLMAAVLANLMPDNPYLEYTLSVWDQGPFLNFNGATRMVSSLWPYLALAWLVFYWSEHRR